MLLLAAISGCCFLTGHVRATSGAPLPNAVVTVRSKATIATRTDASGAFQLHVAAGRYDVRIAAGGYASTEVGELLVDRDESVNVALEPLDTPNLRVIGSIEVNGTFVPSRALVPTTEISRMQMERAGNQRLVDALTSIPSLTFARPDGGGSAAPSLVALRGPDPSETLIALDGQILNDSNTGDLDLARFPVAAFSNVSVTEGLGPSDTEGSSTIGGAVNIISLRPTRDAHSAFSLSAGSFGQSEAWYNATGTRGRLSYAAALDDQQQRGYVDQNALLCGGSPVAPCGTTTPIHLGSSVSSRALLGNFIWNFTPDADLGLRIFVLGNARDESSSYNTPLDPHDQNSGDAFTGPGAATFAQAIRAYDLHGRALFGSGSIVYDASASNNDVQFVGGGISPYDVTHRDKRGNLSVSWERTSGDNEVAFGGYARREILSEDGVAGAQSENIQAYFARGSVEPVQRLRVEAGIFASRYSTFGSNLDGRLGFSYELAPDSVLRASAGTGFRAPLLIERYRFPIDQLPQDANCVAIGQGNPNERPEHATEYELGYARRFDPTTNVDVALYRTNLRDPIENFYPLGAACPTQTPPLTSYPINVGNVIYEGMEVRLAHKFRHLLLDARYGLNVAYPYNLPPTIANPTSGGNLVAYEQFLNIPQQQAALGLAWNNRDWHAALQSYFRGKNNELNQGPFAIVNASVGKRFGRADVALDGTNLTSAVAGRFTLPGLGVPYRGLVQEPDGSAGFGNLPTDARFLEPAGIRIVVTVRN